MKSPIEGHSEVVNCFRERVEKFQDLKADGSNTLNGLEKSIGTGKSVCKNRLDVKSSKSNDSERDIKDARKLFFFCLEIVLKAMILVLRSI
ncbi:hypothetical protein DVH24_038560 [Malus domestica]|uniref:Uncharacterized protein n=1 Tax=Malus domestica TaxID=3750 RepID=A0A498KA98_MALDO|nr:hypothetical protein DVH24_038560 [Malus domestica]